MASHRCIQSVQTVEMPQTWLTHQSTEYDSIPLCEESRTAGNLSPLRGGVVRAYNFREKVSIRYNAFDKDRRELYAKQQTQWTNKTTVDENVYYPESTRIKMTYVARQQKFQCLLRPEAHPASYTMGTGSFPGVKRPGRDVDHPLHLAPMLKKE
jgi:hypothetical protein